MTSSWEKLSMPEESYYEVKQMNLTTSEIEKRSKVQTIEPESSLN